jgi:hypothetical protein
MAKEINIQRNIMLAVSKAGARIFRNNVGTAWAGKSYAAKDGKRVIENAQLIRFGLCTGSSDLIGWKSLTITPEMVGTKVAIFCAVEVKTFKGRARDEQKNFIDKLTNDGGFAGVARTEDEAVEIIRNIKQ